MKAFNTVAIIGLGQIGASLAAALKSHYPKKNIMAFNRSAAALKQARQKKWVDEAYSNIGPWLNDADLIILCVPVKVIALLLKDIKKYVRSDALISDVGSTKQSIVSLAAKLKLNFLGGHPMAGTEIAGIAGADNKLFIGKTWFLILDKKPNVQQQQYAKLLAKLGARVTWLNAATHDSGVMWISHLPHVLAFNALAVVNKWGRHFLGHAGGSFRDLTRVTASSPEMWLDIFLDNRKAVIQGIDILIAQLKVFKVYLTKQNAKALLKFLSETRL